jgi:hypothetical protein
MGHFSFWSILTVNLLGKNITIKKNREALLDASKEIGLEINAEKTKMKLCGSFTPWLLYPQRSL